MCANCTMTSGLTSALAPMSRKTVFLPEMPGNGRESAGRLTPLMRPTPKVAAVRTAPVEPAENRPSASPAWTAAAARTMLASFFLRTAWAGCSSMAMTSVVASARARSWEAANGSTTSASPATSTSSSGSSASAAATPSRRTAGSLSAPMTSTQMVVMLPPWLNTSTALLCRNPQGRVLLARPSGPHAPSLFVPPLRSHLFVLPLRSRLFVPTSSFPPLRSHLFVPTSSFSAKIQQLGTLTRLLDRNIFAENLTAEKNDAPRAEKCPRFRTQIRIWVGGGHK